MHHKTTSATAVTCAHDQCCVLRISPMEILLKQFFLVNWTCHLIRDLTQIKLLTTLMTEICGWRAFPTARTAKHFRKFVRIVTQAKKDNSFPLKNIKLLVPTPPSFSAGANFWCFNLQQLVLNICSNYFKFAATLFYLQQLYLFYLKQGFLTYSNFILFAATFICICLAILRQF